VKKFLGTLAVLTVIASPAFAQSFDPELGTGNIAPADGGRSAIAQAAPKTTAPGILRMHRKACIRCRAAAFSGAPAGPNPTRYKSVG